MMKTGEIDDLGGGTDTWQFINGSSDDKINLSLESTVSLMTETTCNPTVSIAGAIANPETSDDKISFCIQETEVPGTGGKTIDFSTLQELITLWIQETEV